MPISSPTSRGLTKTIAKSFDQPREIVERFYRDLRQERMVPAGRAGRGGFLPIVTSKTAATLVIALLASPSARGAVAAVSRLQKTEGPALRRTINSGHDNFVISPPKASVLEAVESLIDLARSPDVQISMLSLDFSLRVCISLDAMWAEIAHSLTSNKQQFERFYFVDPRAQMDQVISTSFRREASIPNWPLQKIAEFLGCYSIEEWQRVESRFSIEGFHAAP